MRIAFYGNFGVSYSSESHHAASLEALGHDVIRLQEPEQNIQVLMDVANNPKLDLFVWIKTHGWQTPGIDQVLAILRDRRIPIISYHLDMYAALPERWRQYRDDPYMMGLDHFFTVERQMADWLNANTPVKGHFLPAGVYDKECYISTDPSPYANDVIFVGSRRYHPEWQWRPQLIDFLRETYGTRFTHVGGDGDTGTVRGDDLNRVYANSKVAVGDTLSPGFNYPWYASDRLFEAPGRGGFQIFPHIAGLDEWFTDGETIRFFEFGDFERLKLMIDYYLEHDAEREQIRRAGHEHVKEHHTYKNRWLDVIKTVFA